MIGREVRPVDIVMFGFNDWRQWEAQGFRTRCGAIARELAERDEVRSMVVVSSPTSMAAVMMRKVGLWPQDQRARRLSPTRWSGVTHVGEKVWVLDRAQVLPRAGSNALSYRANGVLHDASLMSAVRNAAVAVGMRHPVLWVSDPLMAKYIGSAGEALSVFDAIDDWRFHPALRPMRGCLESGYQIAAERADIVFAVSQALTGYLGTGRGSVYWQPNAVCAKAFSASTSTPQDVLNLPRPLIGYVGVLQERVDVVAVAALSEAMPAASIVLVGPVTAPAHFSVLQGRSNIHFLGERDHHVIPAYLKEFDVCIAPHIDDEFTRSMDPLKLYEYVASGRPVVASGVAGSSMPAGVMHVARTPYEFVDLVRQELSKAMRGEASDSRERTRAVESRSWAARVDEMLSITRSRLVEKCA